MSSEASALNSSEAQVASTATPTPEPLIMQIVVRRDLLDAPNWGIGPLMAQVAHATAAVLHETRTRPETETYLEDLPNMRKVVMQVPNAAALLKLSTLLREADPVVPHHVWIEQPENEPTALALAPNRKDRAVRRALDKAGARVWRS